MAGELKASLRTNGGVVCLVVRAGKGHREAWPGWSGGQEW